VTRAKHQSCQSDHGHLTGLIGIAVPKTNYTKEHNHINSCIINELERDKHKTQKLSKINGFWNLAKADWQTTIASHWQATWDASGGPCQPRLNPHSVMSKF